MNERQKLHQEIKEYEKSLGRSRLKWFIGIWFGYTAFFFWLLKPDSIDDVSQFFDTLIPATVIGLVFWLVNAGVWTHSVNDLQSRTKYLKEMEDKYDKLDFIERERLYNEIHIRR